MANVDSATEEDGEKKYIHFDNVFDGMQEWIEKNFIPREDVREAMKEMQDEVGKIGGGIDQKEMMKKSGFVYSIRILNNLLKK